MRESLIAAPAVRTKHGDGGAATDTGLPFPSDAVGGAYTAFIATDTPGRPRHGLADTDAMRGFGGTADSVTKPPTDVAADRRDAGRDLHRRPRRCVRP